MQEKTIEQAAVSTQRLYYEDSHKSEFTATVLACRAYKDKYGILLDRTSFFPEGGGQFGDTGWLCKKGEEGENAQELQTRREQKAVAVLDTQEKDGMIWHVTDLPLEAGDEVEGRLDFEKRFDRMQQHSGEHILSGIVHRLYGLDNVGFHLGEELTTLDFNGELSKDQVRTVETLANQAVFADLPVEVLYPAKEELAALEYRSKIEIEGQVRIVQIPGVDRCACCAPHVGRTGEIGLIKILSCERHRGGCRMVMVSGSRALQDYMQKQESVEAVSVALSAKQEAVAQAVLHQKEQISALREQLNRLQAASLSGQLEQIRPDQQDVCLFVEDFDMIAVRSFVNQAMERCSGLCAAFEGTEEAGYHYIIGSSRLDTRIAAKALRESFGGKGGGRPEMVQGFVCGKEQEIRALLARCAAEQTGG